MQKFLDNYGLNYFYNKIKAYIDSKVDWLFIFVSNGKALIASAITDMGVETKADATWEEMAENISQIRSSDTSEYHWWSPHMTSDTAPAPFSCEASSVAASNPATWAAWKVFDGNGGSESSSWASASDNPSHPYDSQWIKFDFGKQTYINGIRLYPRTAVKWQFPIKGFIQGSNDNSVWVYLVQIDMSPIESNDWVEFMFSPVSYRYYRIYNMTSNKPGYPEDISIGEIEFSISKDKLRSDDSAMKTDKFELTVDLNTATSSGMQEV